MSDFASLYTFVYAVTVLRATLSQTATNFRFPCGPQDCADAACWNDTREWPTLNYPVSEPFFPNSTQGESKEAICDHLHAATLVVRRNRDVPSISFERTWQDYENGFGVFGNHWLGLKHLHRLSSRGKQVISLIYRTENGNESHMLDGAWDSFMVDGANNLYKLSLGPSRKSIDVMQSAKGQPFYSRDKIKTRGKLRCGLRFSGGWWFGICSGRKSDLINLNGQFNATDADKSVFIGTHVVISAEIRMQPFLYTRDNYTCDKTCPNGGTCQLASDKASYFCRCLPTFTGWQCESQVFSSASSASATSSFPTMRTAQTLVKPTSSFTPITSTTTKQTLVKPTSSFTPNTSTTTKQTLVKPTSSFTPNTSTTTTQTLVKPTSSITTITAKITPQTLVKPTSKGINKTLIQPHTDVYAQVMFISIALSSTICLMSFCIASEMAIWEFKRYRAYQSHNSDPHGSKIPLLQENTSKRHGKGKHRRQKQKGLSDQSDKATQDDTSMAEPIIATHSQREDDKPTEESVNAAHTQTKDIPTESRKKRDTTAEDETPPRHKKKRKSKKNEGLD